MMSPRLASLELLLATLMLAGVFIAGSLAVADINPITVAALRFALAAVMLLAMLPMIGRIPQISLPDLLLIVAAAVTGVFLYNALFFFGLKYSSANHAAAIIATIPIFVTLLERLTRSERPTLAQTVGTLLAFAGVIYIVSRSAFFGGDRAENGSVLLGDALFLAAAFCFAVYSIMGRPLTARLGAYHATTLSIATGSAMLVAAALLVDEAVMSVFTSPNRLSTAAMIVYMALFGTVLAFLLYYRGVRAIGPTKTSMFLNLVPVWVVLLAAAVLGDPITPGVAIAIAAVVLGVSLCQGLLPLSRAELRRLTHLRRV
jgi:drug/metabolite transporter (DMT)-like permease